MLGNADEVMLVCSCPRPLRYWMPCEHLYRVKGEFTLTDIHMKYWDTFQAGDMPSCESSPSPTCWGVRVPKNFVPEYGSCQPQGSVEIDSKEEISTLDNASSKIDVETTSDYLSVQSCKERMFANYKMEQDGPNGPKIRAIFERADKEIEELLSTGTSNEYGNFGSSRPNKGGSRSNSRIRPAAEGGKDRRSKCRKVHAKEMVYTPTGISTSIDKQSPFPLHSSTTWGGKNATSATSTTENKVQVTQFGNSISAFGDASYKFTKKNLEIIQHAGQIVWYLIHVIRTSQLQLVPAKIVQQGDDDWKLYRRGKMTSTSAKIIREHKNDDHRDGVHRKVAEILGLYRVPKTEAMQIGSALEKETIKYAVTKLSESTETKTEITYPAVNDFKPSPFSQCVSVDGFAQCKQKGWYVIECKCTRNDRFFPNGVMSCERKLEAEDRDQVRYTFPDVKMSYICHDVYTNTKGANAYARTGCEVVFIYHARHTTAEKW